MGLLKIQLTEVLFKFADELVGLEGSLVVVRSVSLTVFPSRGEAGVFHACIGIDVQALRSAPAREGLRVYVNPFGDESIPFEAILDALRGLLPFVECGGQLVAVLEHFSATGVVLAFVPSDSVGSDGLLCHGRSL